MELEEAKQLKGGFRIHFEIAVNSHSYLPVLATFTTKILDIVARKLREHVCHTAIGILFGRHAVRRSERSYILFDVSLLASHRSALG